MAQYSTILILIPESSFISGVTRVIVVAKFHIAVQILLVRYDMSYNMSGNRHMTPLWISPNLYCGNIKRGSFTHQYQHTLDIFLQNYRRWKLRKF